MSNYTRNTVTTIGAVNAELEKIEQSIEDKFDRSPDSGQANQLNGNLDVNSNRIYNIPEPTSDSDVVSKGYVDETVDTINSKLQELPFDLDTLDQTIADGQAAISDFEDQAEETLQAISQEADLKFSELTYSVPVEYTSGITFLDLTDRTKTVIEDGVYYAPKPNSIPFTTTGDFNVDSSDFYPIIQKSLTSGRNLLVDGRYDFWYEGTGSFNTPNPTGAYRTSTMSATLATDEYYEQRNIVSSTSPAKIENPTVIYEKRVRQTESIIVGSHALVENWFIEDVRTLAGQDIAFSFYIETSAGRPVAIEFVQNFGSGGSTQVEEIGVTKLAITDTQTRYSVTTTLPSIAGKTIGVGSYVGIRMWFSASSNFDSKTDSLGMAPRGASFTFTCLQLESGTQMTKFEEKTPRQAMSDLNRYFWQGLAMGRGASFSVGLAGIDAYTGASCTFPTMRDVPSASIVTEPTYTNCSSSDLTPTVNSILHRVNITTGSPARYRALLGEYKADARLGG